MNRTDFLSFLETNESIVILFLNATWCKPCSLVKQHVMERGSTCGYRFFMVDIDQHSDLYAALKSKKQVIGVPTLLAYKSKNVSLISDKSMSGMNIKEIDAFFKSLDSL